MAQDLKLAGAIIKPTRPEIGQFWRDTINGDVLKILEFNETELKQGEFTTYVVSACYPHGEYYLGPQEMKASHFEEERFQPITLSWLKNFWWSRVKFRKP